MPEILPPRQMMRSLFTSNRPAVRRLFGNNVICSTHSTLHLRPWDGGLKTVSVLKSLPSGLDVQELVANAECFLYHAQQQANAMTLAIQWLMNDEMLTLSINWLLILMSTKYRHFVHLLGLSHGIWNNVIIASVLFIP